jgi:hypothetical protein
VLPWLVERDALAAALVDFDADAERLLPPLEREALTEPEALVRLDAEAPRLLLPRESVPAAVALASLFALAESDLVPAEPVAEVALAASPRRVGELCAKAGAAASATSAVVTIRNFLFILFLLVDALDLTRPALHDARHRQRCRTPRHDRGVRFTSSGPRRYL